MKIEIITALVLSVPCCIPTPVIPIQDVFDSNSEITVIDSATLDTQLVTLDSSTDILDSSSVNDSYVVIDSAVVQQDSANDDTGLDEISFVCSKACNNLVKLGCSEGKDSACISVCKHVSQTHLIKFDAKCLSTAKDIKAVKNCGGVSCKK